jgi:membrane peptidoglycan carboxypeptidase
MGKTGTANRFTNSAFAGVIPGPHSGQNGFSTINGYVVAAYVGFDNNDPMVRNNTHITGASGALPVWTRMANSILLEKEFGTELDLVDLAFSFDPITGQTGLRLIQPDLEQKNISVNRGNGLPVRAQYVSTDSAYSANAKVLSFGTLLPSGEIEPNRTFQPFWSN